MLKLDSLILYIVEKSMSVNRGHEFKPIRGSFSITVPRLRAQSPHMGTSVTHLWVEALEGNNLPTPTDVLTLSSLIDDKTVVVGVGFLGAV